MLLIWSDEARHEFRAAIDFIAERNKLAAERLADRIIEASERLTDHPYAHRPGRIDGTREAVVHPNYILIYRVTANAIEILTLVHTRQQYP
ncbi:type II toxin-antitoxin system RelE/ParE family toxin [Sphingomonas sp. ID0503]|uniref:type II toxin-antitoxin system RelE/ParE family toxin n=1 Tax=Sphingomonas sp. ID0503 TaxID=3399691 RepID=UPI003AFAC835